MSGRGTADFNVPITEVAIAIVERAVSLQLWALFLDIKQVGTSRNTGLCKFTNKQIPRPHPGLEKSEYLKLGSKHLYKTCVGGRGWRWNSGGRCCLAHTESWVPSLT